MSDNDESEFKMRVLEFTLKLLTICGCWRPESWTSLYKRTIYHVYTIFVLFLVNTFTLSQFMDIILTVDNPDDFSDNVCTLLAMFNTSCKMCSLLMNHEAIIRLTDKLCQKPCRPLKSNEMEIQSKFDKRIQNYTFYYTCLCMCTCTSITLTSVLTKLGKRQLTYRAWFPFEYSSTALFYLVYAHQLIGLTMGALLNVACDTVVCGFLMQICCQFEILACRLKRIYSDYTLSDCVQQHYEIFRLAIMVNSTFKLIIAFQFGMSMLVVCFNLYQLTKVEVIGGYIQIAMYMSCMLTQIFIFCWYGNEVKLKSRQLADDIFEINWLTLDMSTQKSLIIIMERTTLPIEISSFSIIVMNIDSFTYVLKTSYSAYNLLKQTQQQQQ